MPTRACPQLLIILVVVLATGHGQHTPLPQPAGPAEAAALKIEAALAALAITLVAGEAVQGIDREWTAGYRSPRRASFRVTECR